MNEFCVRGGILFCKYERIYRGLKNKKWNVYFIRGKRGC